MVFETPLSQWRHYLQDMNFWLHGYLNSDAYRKLERKLDIGAQWVMWNLGIEEPRCNTCWFTRAISSIARDVSIRRHGPLDHVIEVDMKQTTMLQEGKGLSINSKLAIKVAEQLGLLNQKLKAEGEELWYYTYGQEAVYPWIDVQGSIVPQINQTLAGKKYLLVVENLNEPIKPTKVDAFTEDLECLPPPKWKDSFWILSVTSRDVYARIYPGLSGRTSLYIWDDMLMLTLYSLHQAAKYILVATRHKDEKYWHCVAVRCFHYATMLLIPHFSSARGHGDQQSSDALTADELIRQWAAQGIITSIQDRTGEVTSARYHSEYNTIYQVGNVILEAFQEYSLLQLPLSLASNNVDTMISAAHFLAHIVPTLLAEHHTIDELCEGNHPGMEHMQWISHVGDQGCHVRREWLNHGSNGPSSLTIRHCSRQSRLFAKLNHLLAKLPYLRVLDLSYTEIQSLPPSVCCLQQLQLLYLSNTPLELLPASICLLQKLQFLSLRGCYNLTSPFNFSKTEAIVPENNSNEKINLLYLDLSYSNINTFHCDFFHHMPDLQELLFVKCFNLEELPPSIVSLSSLTRLELTGTQIKSISWEMFEEMKMLQSLKLIENRILLFALPRLVSKLCGLIDVHIEGYESTTEVTIERHPTLRSFTIIGAPHMRRLSLRGCKMLGHVDIKEVDGLEEVDLSATAIKELPDNIPNLPQLRQLLLMGVPSLRRFPWHKVQRLPSVFCLDHFSDDRTTNHSNPQVARVCISDSRLFYSLNSKICYILRNNGFYVRVTSCKTTTRKVRDEEDMVETNRLQEALTAYADVRHCYTTAGVSMVSMDDVPLFRETERHVEMSSADRYPHALKPLLDVTKSFSMSDDAHVSSPSDLTRCLRAGGLKECMLRRCHRMVHVFNMRQYDQETLYVEKAYVSHLKSLTHFCRARLRDGPFRPLPPFPGLRRPSRHRKAFVEQMQRRFLWLVAQPYSLSYALKHLVLENCPSSHPSPSPGYLQLPCLRRIRLQELPLLEHLHVDDPTLDAPKWEELHVRGCWSLCRLPRLRQQPAKAVKASGERAWWNKLRWHDHRSHYEPRLPPAYASIRERVIIRTYLR
ncbi:unnamed protein product [Urochloa decumbens]|uniref:Uncharacterized protein n=1 Tax=Urochloa decumbens TaxID=240449 RepID=A0ABC9F3H9_9POAL